MSSMLSEFVGELFEPVGKIKSVSMLGHDKEKHGEMEWDASLDGLVVKFPRLNLKSNFGD